MPKPVSKRADRVADQVRMEVADILMRRAKDPRLDAVTVTDVEMTSDLRLARVYVTTLQGPQDEGGTMASLEHAAGFIRAELGRRLNLRYTPELSFHKDVSGPRGDRILRLLSGVLPEQSGDQSELSEKDV